MSFVASRARLVLKQFNSEGKLASGYPYPIQVWRLGPMVLVALGGEAWWIIHCGSSWNWARIKSGSPPTRTM